MKNYMIALLGLLFIAQWAAPLSMIVQRETTLRKGATFKFRTAPVDPYDAFRGRYVALSFADAALSQSNLAERVKRNQRVYVRLSVADDGMAYFTDLTTRPPTEGDYLRLRVTSVYNDQVRLELPFNRFYMEESEAPEAERIYARRRERVERDACAVVRVYEGRAVLEDVLVDGKPLRAVVHEERAANGEGS